MKIYLLVCLILSLFIFGTASSKVEIGNNAFVYASYLTVKDRIDGNTVTKLPVNSEVVVTDINNNYAVIEYGENGEKGYVKLKYLREDGIKHPFSPTKSNFQKQKYSIELLIDDPNKKTRKSFWGHATLRAKGPGFDQGYDFGRYGKVWGKFNTLGDPVLRVWSNLYQYIHNKIIWHNSPVYRFVFKASKEEVEEIMHAYQESILKDYPGAKVATGMENKGYLFDGDDFHFVTRNCTTTALEKLEDVLKVKISTNANIKKYAKIDGIFLSYKLAIKSAVSSEELKRFWWPKDLLNVLLKKAHHFKKLIKIEKWDKAAYKAKKAEVIMDTSSFLMENN